MKDVIILAMGTLSKVLIVTLRPQLKVLFMHPLKVLYKPFKPASNPHNPSFYSSGRRGNASPSRLAIRHHPGVRTRPSHRPGSCVRQGQGHLLLPGRLQLPG